MRRNTKKQHSVDILFVLTLFCVLAISSLVVVYMGSAIYSKTVETMDITFNTHLVLDYLTEKVHQGNTSNQITVTDINGMEVLCIQENYEEVPYVTYIYHDSNELKELFIPKDSPFVKENGETIMKIDTLSLEIHDAVLQVYVSHDNKSHISYISLLKEDITHAPS